MITHNFVSLGANLHKCGAQQRAVLQRVQRTASTPRGVHCMQHVRPRTHKHRHGGLERRSVVKKDHNRGEYQLPSQLLDCAAYTARTGRQVFDETGQNCTSWVL